LTYLTPLKNQTLSASYAHFVKPTTDTKFVLLWNIFVAVFSNWMRMPAGIKRLASRVCLLLVSKQLIHHYDI